MAKWHEIALIERTVSDARETEAENVALYRLVYDMTRDLRAAQAQAQLNWAEFQRQRQRAEEAEAARDVWRARHEELAESVRQSQQRARMVRSGE